MRQTLRSATVAACVTRLVGAGGLATACALQDDGAPSATLSSDSIAQADFAYVQSWYQLRSKSDTGPIDGSPAACKGDNTRRVDTFARKQGKLVHLALVLDANDQWQSTWTDANADGDPTPTATDVACVSWLFSGRDKPAFQLFMVDAAGRLKTRLIDPYATDPVTMVPMPVDTHWTDAPTPFNPAPSSRPSVDTTTSGAFSIAIRDKLGDVYTTGGYISGAPTAAQASCPHSHGGFDERFRSIGWSGNWFAAGAGNKPGTFSRDPGLTAWCDPHAGGGNNPFASAWVAFESGVLNNAPAQTWEFDGAQWSAKPLAVWTSTLTAERSLLRDVSGGAAPVWSQRVVGLGLNGDVWMYQIDNKSCAVPFSLQHPGNVAPDPTSIPSLARYELAPDRGAGPGTDLLMVLARGGDGFLYYGLISAALGC
jgi:hypothetical protein